MQLKSGLFKSYSPCHIFSCLVLWLEVYNLQLARETEFGHQESPESDSCNPVHQSVSGRVFPAVLRLVVCQWEQCSISDGIACTWSTRGRKPSGFKLDFFFHHSSTLMETYVKRWNSSTLQWNLIFMQARFW